VEKTPPTAIELREGRNTLEFTCKAPNKGVTIKHFQVTPVNK
jgi:hypothetical protein